VIHILRLGHVVPDGDPECAALAILSDAYGWVAGSEAMASRTRLADLIGPGLLADLLRGGRPLRVASAGARGVAD
jgi:hypothetical protein